MVCLSNSATNLHLLRVQMNSWRVFDSLWWPKMDNCGHCVYGDTGWYSNFYVHRAKDCDPNQGTKHTWKAAVTLDGWINNHNPENDIGWIIVGTPSLVSMSFTFVIPPVTATTIFIYGYPADLPTTSSPNWCLYGTSCPLVIVESKRLRYKCDTYGDTSGSGVYYSNSNNVYTIIGVHAYGVSQGTNSGTCMTTWYYILTDYVIRKYGA